MPLVFWLLPFIKLSYVFSAVWSFSKAHWTSRMFFLSVVMQSVSVPTLWRSPSVLISASLMFQFAKPSEAPATLCSLCAFSGTSFCSSHFLARHLDFYRGGSQHLLRTSFFPTLTSTCVSYMCSDPLHSRSVHKHSHGFHPISPELKGRTLLWTTCSLKSHWAPSTFGECFLKGQRNFFCMAYSFLPWLPRSVTCIGKLTQTIGVDEFQC